MFNRFYEDYLKKSRLEDYHNILSRAKSKNYCMLGIQDFYKIVDSPGRGSNRYLINRHDIDTSPAVAREMFEVEKSVYGQNGSATYYFRSKTIDNALIADIDAFGYETGFHYETVAEYAKEKHIHSKEEMLSALPQIRRVFIEELEAFRTETESESLTVSSHGDFVNVKLGIMNTVILEDKSTRDEAGIILEAYDEAVNKPVRERFADQILLGAFASNVIEAIERNVDVIMILTHPRNQKADIWWNTKDNLGRIAEGLAYGIKK